MEVVSLAEGRNLLTSCVEVLGQRGCCVLLGNEFDLL